MIETIIEDILQGYQTTIGKEFEAYKNHVHRVAILTLKIKRKQHQDDIRKIAIASAFHDIGIWTEKTFDYLDSSMEEAAKYLKNQELGHWIDEISLIISMHHKRSTYKGDFVDNVESFRRADSADVSKGRIAFGVSPEIFKKNYELYPLSGFRTFLVKQFFKNWIRHPFNPLPMFKK